MILPFDKAIFRAGSRVCVAVSGGADSVALLCALREANALPRGSLGVGITATHVHHGVRGDEADADADFVHSLCARLEIPLAIHRVCVPQYREATGETLEEAARNLRYQIFDTILSEGSVDDLLTAHTLDDQAETVLMKLLRGAWTQGLSGIYPVLLPPQTPGKRILRPLLGTRRSEVVAYLHSIDQPWREDSSNGDPAHTRNRLRHHILPVLRQENPSLDRTLASLAQLAREDEEHWQRELTRVLPQILLPGSPVRGGGRAASGAPTVALEIERLRALDSSTRRRVLRHAVRTLPNAAHPRKGFRLTFEETSRLLALCGLDSSSAAESRQGTTLSLRQNLVARRSLREIRFSVES